MEPIYISQAVLVGPAGEAYKPGDLIQGGAAWANINAHVRAGRAVALPGAFGELLKLAAPVKPPLAAVAGGRK